MTDIVQSEVLPAAPVEPVADGYEFHAERSLPSGYATIELGLELYGWQVDVMNELDLPGIRVALRTNNESGKTSTVIAPLVLWHMATFPGSLTITTSGAYRQIIGQLYPNLTAYTAGKSEWLFQKDTGLYHPTNSRLISFSTDDPGLAEGWHEPPQAHPVFAPGAHPLGAYGISDLEWEAAMNQKTSLLIIIDEAKSVDQGIFDAFERCHPTRYLIASTPGEPAGPFYDCFHAEAHRYKQYHCSWVDCPHLYEDPVKHREISEFIQTRGDSDPLVQSLAFGEFSQSGEYMLFDMVKVAEAMSQLLPQWGRGERRAALDVSGGGDEAPLYMRDGNECELIGSWRESDDAKLCRQVIKTLERYQFRPEWVFADDGGLGSPILNQLDRRHWPVNRINFAGKPRNQKYYRNVRAEMYSELAQRVRAGEIRLPRDAELRDQLSWQKRLPGDGPMVLVPKKSMRRSPDRADCIAMLFYNMAKATEYLERKQQLDRRFSKTMDPDHRDFQVVQSDRSSTGLWGL